MMRHSFNFFLILSILALLPVVTQAQVPSKPQTLPSAETRPPPGFRPRAESQQQRIHIREIFSLRSNQAKVQRFESMRGLPAFILDKSGPQTLFRYEFGGEVLILTPVHTTRGDTIYKNDQGAVILRLRRVGSATIFPKPRSQGIVAWSTGSALKLGPPEISRLQMQKMLGRIADDLATELDQNISIEIKGATDQSAWIFLDTARNLTIAVQGYLQQKPKRARIHTIRKIFISVAERPSATFNKDAIFLSVTPETGFSGRLSSLQLLYLLNQNAQIQTSTSPQDLANNQIK